MGLLVHILIEWLTQRHDAWLQAREDARWEFEVLPPNAKQMKGK